MSIRINPLSIINEWLANNPYHDHSDMPYNDLIRWVRDKNPRFSDKEAILATDCLIAAGIGREPEQTQTVYGGYCGCD